MRLLFAALFLVGLGLVGYAQLAERLPRPPIGSWPVHAPVSGFLAIDARLLPADAPVEVYIDLTASGTPKFDADRAVLTLTAAVGGKTVLAKTLTFEDAVVRDDTPQTPELIYRSKAGRIDAVDAADPLYRFTTGPGDADGIDIAKVDLVLERGAQKADPRIQPVGFGLMAIGFIGFALALRRGGGTPPNPNSKPPPPRWGRAAG